MIERTDLSETLLAWGLSEPEPLPRTLQAGPVSVDYKQGVLRTLRVDGREVVRMINFALRDQDWNTVPYEVLEEQVQCDRGGFEVQCRVRFLAPPIDYEAHIELHGDADGTIRCTFEGLAKTEFRRNRIGFTVLHPLEDCSGQPILVCHVDGRETEGHFPAKISPYQPFFDVAKIQWWVGGRELSLQFEGDVFEMEDQRNWSDASYKTYCTPLSRPFPVTVEAGERVSQKVVFRPAWSREIVVPAVPRPVNAREEVVLRRPAEAHRLPALGVARSSESESLIPLECARLQALAFSHYRCELDLTRSDWPVRWARACDEGQKLALPLELVVWATPSSDFDALATRLQGAAASLRHLLLLSRDAKTSTAALLAKALPVLRHRCPSLPLGAGTDAFFAELNRHPPPIEGLDFLSYSLNPQVHAFDRLSLVENVEAQADTVESARALAHPAKVHVSPVTLRMRWNPNATSTATFVSEAVPGDVDIRQLALFGAGWTLRSVAVLASAGAAAATYYETLGTRGLMQTTSPRFATAFPAPAGMVYPVYLVFHELAGFKRIERLTKDLRITAVLLPGDAPNARILLANHTSSPVTVAFPEGFVTTESRGLAPPIIDAHAHLLEEFISRAFPAGARMELPPFAFVSLDGQMGRN